MQFETARIIYASLDLQISGIGLYTRNFDGAERLMHRLYTNGKVAEEPTGRPVSREELLERAQRACLEDSGRPAGARVAWIHLNQAAGALESNVSTPSSVQNLAKVPDRVCDNLAEGLSEARNILENGLHSAVILSTLTGGDDPGAASILLTPKPGGDTTGLPGYARLRIAARVNLAPVDGQRFRQSVRLLTAHSLHMGLVLPADLGALHISGKSFADWMPEELDGLADALPAAGAGMSAAIGACQDPLMGLITVCLSLSRRVIPGYSSESMPAFPAVWENTCLYYPSGTRTWFKPRGAPDRTALLVDRNDRGEMGQVLIQESEVPRADAQPRVSDFGSHLILAGGRTIADFEQELDRLTGELDSGTSLPALSRAGWNQYRGQADGVFNLALLGRDPQEMRKEIEYSRKGVAQAITKGAEWQTPLGSYFTANPLGPNAQVAFVYPGAFNTYTGAGKDLFNLYPQVYQQLSQLTSDMGRVLRERLLYPRVRGPLSQSDLDAMDLRLTADAVTMLSSGSTLSVMHTLLLREIFKVEPKSAFGYSLGETSMLFALKVWANGDKSEAILDSSELFKKRISGEREAVRDFWKETHVEPDNPDLWANYILMLPAEQVETALSGSRRVFLTHVNTPRQVVIGGDPLECQRIIAELKAPSLRAPFDHVLHCEAMAGEYPGILEMNIWPIWQDPGLRLYTADTYAPLVIEPEEIAASLSRMLCKPLDFPRLIHEVYQAGARIFVEVGAGSNCSRWISETLKDSPHLAVSMDRKGSDDAPAITRALARLACHHVPLNLEALFQPGRS